MRSIFAPGRQASADARPRPLFGRLLLRHADGSQTFCWRSVCALVPGANGPSLRPVAVGSGRERMPRNQARQNRAELPGETDVEKSVRNGCRRRGAAGLWHRFEKCRFLPPAGAEPAAKSLGWRPNWTPFRGPSRPVGGLASRPGESISQDEPVSRCYHVACPCTWVKSGCQATERRPLGLCGLCRP